METYYTKKERIQFKPPVFSQIAGMIFGVIFAFSEGRTGMELVVAVLCSPVIFAGIVRVIIAMYRAVANLTAQKVYDETGRCISMIPHRGVSFIAALIGFAGIVTLFTTAAQYSQFLMYILAIGLLTLEVFVFWRDVKTFIQLRSYKEEG